MKREIVIASSGGRLLTSGGFRPVAGNLGFGPGGQVFVLDGVVLGQKRQQSRPMNFITATVAVQPPIPLSGYRFADASALKMYYVDYDFVLQRTEDLLPPVEAARLLLHSYNESVEYFVWFINGRCIIHKNGDIIADFTSVFSEQPVDSDAYIDDAGDLVWVAIHHWYSFNAGDPCVIARYRNGTLEKVKDDFVSVALAEKAQFGAECNAQMAASVASARHTAMYQRTAHNQALYKSWVPKAAYALYDWFFDDDSGKIYRCYSAGSSGVVEPNWASGAATIYDGTIEWRIAGIPAYASPWQTIEQEALPSVGYYPEQGSSFLYTGMFAWFLWEFSVATTLVSGIYSGQITVEARQRIWDYPGGSLVADNTTIQNSAYIGHIYRYRGILISESGVTNFVEETKASSFSGVGQLNLRKATITPETREVVNSDGETVSMSCLNVVDDIEIFDSVITAEIPAASFSATPVALNRLVNEHVTIRQIIDKPDWLPAGAEYYYQWDALYSNGSFVYDLAHNTSSRLVGAPWAVAADAAICVVNGYPDPATNIIKVDGGYSEKVSPTALQNIVTKRFV